MGSIPRRQDRSHLQQNRTLQCLKGDSWKSPTMEETVLQRMKNHNWKRQSVLILGNVSYFVKNKEHYLRTCRNGQARCNGTIVVVRIITRNLVVDGELSCNVSLDNNRNTKKYLVNISAISQKYAHTSFGRVQR